MQPRLCPEEVVVYRVSASEGAAWERWLCPEERAQADSLPKPLDRQHFVACRGVLRSVLGSHLRCAPAQVPLLVGSDGKPRLADEAVSFSIAHAAGLGLIAVTVGRRVGVDVESTERRVEVELLTQEFLCAEDRARVHCAPSDERVREFFRAWTRNEARVKATGRGLVFPADPPRAEDPRVEELPLEEPWIGALAADGEWRLRLLPATATAGLR